MLNPRACYPLGMHIDTKLVCGIVYRDEAMSATRLRQTLEAWRATPPQWADSNSSWLHPYESCLLAASRAGDLDKPPLHARALNTCVARLGEQERRSVLPLLQACGLGATDAQREKLQRGCSQARRVSWVEDWCKAGREDGLAPCLHGPGMPLHARASLLWRFLPAAADGGSSAAPGAPLLSVLRSGAPLHILGDSVARQIASAARCDAHRAAGWAGGEQLERALSSLLAQTRPSDVQSKALRRPSWIAKQGPAPGRLPEAG